MGSQSTSKSIGVLEGSSEKQGVTSEDKSLSQRSTAAKFGSLQLDGGIGERGRLSAHSTNELLYF
jgi:hypothetical protein